LSTARLSLIEPCYSACFGSGPVRGASSSYHQGECAKAQTTVVNIARKKDYT
jgi:hypothetical protein